MTQEPTGPGVEVGPNIRSHRQQRGLSLRDLAARVGVSASALSQIETGRSRPSVDTLYGVAQALGVTPDEIFFGTESPGSGSQREPASTAPHRPAPPGPNPAELAHGYATHLAEVLELVPRAAQQVVTLKGGETCRQIGGRTLPGVDCLLLTYDPGAASPGADEFVRHAGHEFNFVVSGRIEVHVEQKVYPLGQGDTLTFPSEWPHRVVNPGAEPAEVLCLFVRGESVN